MNNIRTVIETITPRIAQIYLEQNIGNRPVRKSTVAALAQLMRRGEFLTTHQGIAFDTNGYLVDGQHRLLAVIQYGGDVKMFVTTGLEPKVFHALDCGITRSMADRTMIDRRTCSIINKLLLIFKKLNIRATADQIFKIHAVLHDELIKFAEYNRRKVLRLSQTEICVAVILRKIQYDKLDIFEQYRFFVRSQFNEMWPSVQALYGQVMNTKKFKNYELLHRAYLAFDMNKRNVNKIVLASPAQVAHDINQFVSELFSGLNI